MNQYTILEHLITDPKFGGKKKISVKYVTNCHTVYFNAQHLFLQLKPLERCFFDFLVECAKKDSSVFVDVVLKKNFFLHLEKVGKGIVQPPSPRTLQNFLLKLTKLGLILKSPKDGIYYINPKYVSVAGSSKRTSLLKLLLSIADRGEIDPSPLLDKCVEEYFGSKASTESMGK